MHLLGILSAANFIAIGCHRDRRDPALTCKQRSTAAGLLGGAGLRSEASEASEAAGEVSQRFAVSIWGPHVRSGGENSCTWPGTSRYNMFPNTL